MCAKMNFCLGIFSFIVYNSLNVHKIIEVLKKNGHNILSIENHVMNEDGNYFNTKEQTSSYINQIDNSQCKRICVAEKVYHAPLLAPHPNFVPTGSLLPSLCALSHLAEKINVFGWFKNRVRRNLGGVYNVRRNDFIATSNVPPSC